MKKLGRPTKDDKRRIRYNFCIDPELLIKVQGEVTKIRVAYPGYSMSDFINEAIRKAIPKSEKG